MSNSDRHICILTSGRLFELGYGGEERFTLLLAEWLVKRGEGVILMASTFSSVKSKRLTLQEIENDRIFVPQKKKVRVMNPPYLIYWGSRFVLSLLWIIKIIIADLKYKIWVIHSQDTGYSGLSAILAGKLLRIPVVLTSHGIRHKTLESSIRGRFRNLILKLERFLDIFTVRNADMVIAVNPSIKKYLEKESFREIEFIPACIKTSEYRFSVRSREQIRKELGIDLRTIVVGFVGRFSNEKNLDTLLASFKNVLLTNPDLKLVLVGTGLAEISLRKFVTTYGLEDNVIFCGVRFDISRVLSCFDIFILPSLIEGLSISLLEAMACGRAIICSDIDANRALITHETSGLLVDPRDEKAIAHAIETLSRNKVLRSKLGANAEITASLYDEATICSKILQRYCSFRNKKIDT